MIRVLVQTCDRYSEVIPKWLTFFYRHWTLPHRVTILGVSRGSLRIPVDLHDKPVSAFYFVADGGWASNLLRYLHTMNDEPFLMFMDDHIVFEVNNELIQTAYEIVQRPDVGCVRLVPWPGPTLPYDVEGFGEINKALEYSISLQASFWKPQTFRDLLDRRWSPWEIEIEGSKVAANYHKKFIGCKTCAVNYKDYFLRGNPRPEHAAWVDRHL
jgi:hypothetical protein